MLSQRNEIIQTLQNQDVNIFPLRPKSKIPLDSWKQYQTDKFNGTIPDECNFAVVCGDISGDLVVFDFDQCKDIGIIEQIFPNVLNSTLVVQTNRGFHVYIKTNKLPKSMKIARGNLMIDLQSTGKYVVGPTSIHPDGPEYKIISTTTKIMLIDCREKLENLIENGFVIQGLLDGFGTTGKDIAKGGIKNGSLHNSFLKYCNHLLLTVGMTDWHTYCVETDRWNDIGNNEYQINKPDFERVRKDAWDWAHKKIQQSEQGDDTEKTEDDYADDIMASWSFKTLKDTEELLYYKDGAYHLDLNCSIIKEECERIVEKCTSHLCNEIVNKIKRRTYANREDFDSDPDIINVKNGLVNLKTLERSDHTPLYLSRIQLPIEYKPNVIPYTFLKYISECLPRGQDLHRIMEAFASCLIRSAKFEKAFMLIGEGANGKSTFLEIIQALLGNDNVSNVSIHDLTEQRFVKAELDGKMANIYADVESHELKKTGTLKALISGDMLLVEKKNQQPFRMKNFAKMFFSANRFPDVLDQSNAMFRRFVIVDWVISFEKRKDINLKQKLRESDELSGIFNILLRLARDLDKRGSFKFSVDIETLRKTWNEKADPVRKFIDEELVLGEDLTIEKASLYGAYTQFCIRTNSVLEDRSFLYSKIISLTSMYEDRKKIGGEALRLFTGGTLRSKLREASQEAL